MAKDKQGFSVWKLVVALCILVAVIGVGACIGLVVLNNDNHSENIIDDAVLPEELQGDDLSPIDQITKETTLMNSDPDYNGEDIEDYYDVVIGEAMASGDTGFAAQIVVQKMQFIAVDEEECPKVIEYINSINLEDYSVEARPYLASHVVSVANYCEDQTLADNWQRLISGGANE